MKLRVVMVDDEPYSRELFKLSVNFEELNMELVALLDMPQQLLEQLDELQPDIVVTDIQMQDIDGLELIRRVQETAPDCLAFVLLSGYTQVDYAKQAIQLGVRYYVVKPYFPEEIMSVLQKVGDELREKRAQQTRDRRLNQNMLGRSILRLIYESGKPAQELYLPMPLVSYGVIGLFATDAVKCIHDITIIHQLLTNMSAVSIVIRQPMKVEFVISAGDEEDLQTMCSGLRQALEECRLDHDYYAVIAAPGRNAAEIRQSWQSVCTISRQSVWREDRHWMQEEWTPSMRAVPNRLPEIVTAMELGEKEWTALLLHEQLRDYREALISPKNLQIMTDQLVYRSLSLNIVSDSGTLFAEYESKLHNMDQLYVEQVESLLLAYCTRFISLLETYREQLRNRDDPILLIRKYIAEHYHEQLTVQKIASELFFHPAYIGVLFKKNMGVSIHQYLHQVRIGHAMEMMKNENIKLTQIALEVGYNDYPSFITTFRQIQGVSPSSFRRDESIIDENL